MRELLFLAHRIPYPPDKGDKIRSWHFLEGLARQYRVHLGCFVDDQRDWRHRPHLEAVCESTCLVPLHPRRRRLESLRGLIDGQALTQHYYASGVLSAWVRRIADRPKLAGAFVFCSSMAQHLPPTLIERLPCIADVVDVDSEKWLDYAGGMSFPKSWIYRREGRALRKVERVIARDFASVLVATEAEGDLYRSFLPPLAGNGHDKIQAIENGVDADYFSPLRDYDKPPEMTGTALVFTGAMDYWPNIDAMQHFVADILPLVRERHPEIKLLIVGSNPTKEVKKLHDGQTIIVTGRVPDVRPYIAHATLIVAPLRIARGVQNKVLEGMAMGKIVVASPEALTGIRALPGSEILSADGPQDFAAKIDAALEPDAAAIGEAARLRVAADYSWTASQAKIVRLLQGDAPAPDMKASPIATRLAS